MRLKTLILSISILCITFVSSIDAKTFTGVLKSGPNFHKMQLHTYYPTGNYTLTKSGHFSPGDTVVVKGTITGYSEINVESIDGYECCLHEELELRGDVNLDGNYNIADIVMLAQIINGNHQRFILCPDDLDVNGDLETNKSDLDYLYNFLFFKGPVPVRCD